MPTPLTSSYQSYAARQISRARRPRTNANPYDLSHQSPAEDVVDEPSYQNTSPSEGPRQYTDEQDGNEVEGDAEVEEDVDIENGEGEGDGEGAIEEVPMEIESTFDPTGLKEIGNLASWTVSTSKPGCGVEALRDDDTELFWQSDGPQPHHLNIHFSRMVSILSIRLYLDFEADESYTPTKITLLAGTGYHDLIPFSSLEFTQPKGWIDVPLEDVGGGPDGNTLKAFLVQVKVVENHQNGKDTHLRGLKLYARDERVGNSAMDKLRDALEAGREGGVPRVQTHHLTSMLVEPDWMGEPELR